MKIIQPLKKQPKWENTAIVDDGNNIIGFKTTYIPETLEECIRPEYERLMEDLGWPIPDKNQKLLQIKYPHVYFWLNVLPIGFSRGRSSVSYDFIDPKTGIPYTMGVKSIHKLMKMLAIKKASTGVVGGIECLFRVVNHGGTLNLDPTLEEEMK